MPTHSSAPTGGWRCSPDQLAAAALVPIVSGPNLPLGHPESRSSPVRRAHAVPLLPDYGHSAGSRKPQPPISPP